MNKFESIEPDYQVTAETADIDLARILRENIDAGCQYVFILTQLTFAVFVTKTLANRIKKADMAESINLSDIVDERNYGFVRVSKEGNERNDTVGNTIRSIGFTGVAAGAIQEYDMVKDTLDSMDLIEEAVEYERKKNAWKMNVIKVIAG